jgi:serine/threonine-protein kinase
MASSGLLQDLRTFLSLSPDGTRLAYTSYSEGKMQLHLRELNQLQSRPLGPPLENPNFSPLVFSPDGEWLAFYHQGSFKKIALNGGGVQTIAEDTLNSGLDWAADDVLLFGTSNGGMAQIDSSSGVVQELVSPTSTNDVYFWQQFLRGSDVILYTRVPGPGATETSPSVLLFNKQTDESRLLIQNATNATYSATGHIVFIREGSLWAMPFDRENLRIGGTEVKLIEGIDGTQVVILSAYTLSKNGDLLYLPGEGTELRGAPNSTVSWVDRNGEETPLELPPQAYQTPTLSPDGTQLALTIKPSITGEDLWKYDLSRRTLSRITFSGFVINPLWNPAGDRLVYDTPEGIRAINSTGIGNPEVLLMAPSRLFDRRRPAAFTPDGTGLLYSEIVVRAGNRTPTSINQLSLAPEHTTQEVIVSEFGTHRGVISPNGRWLAYVTSETGQDEVYIRPWPDIDSNRSQISSGGGSDPQWAADTGELFFRNNTEDGIETWVVSVATEGDFNAGIPELLFTSDHIVSSLENSYSVAADGQRFVMLKPIAGAERVAVDTNLVLVENFAAELRRLVPPNPQ